MIVTDTDLWLRRFHPAADGAGQVILFPHAGGAASYYRALAARLAPQFDARVVQYPGRQDRRLEPGPDDITELAAQIVGATGARLQPPFAFFGHSMGAVVAFETARLLAAAGSPQPAVLLVSARRAPSLPRVEPVRSADDHALIADVRALAGAGAGALDDEELLEMVLPALRSDYRAIERYRYRPGAALACPVIGLAGRTDPRASPADVAAWADHTAGPFVLHEFTGGHFFIDSEQAAVAGVIGAALGIGGRNDDA